MLAPRRCLMALLVVILLSGGSATLHAHQDPCHRLHSCPSDHNTYVCGDQGRCDQCPDNQYCKAGKPHVVTQPAPQVPQPSHGQSQTATVQRVIDGDTLELSTGEKVRFIGVDTPETKDPRKPVQYFGKEATAFTQQLVQGSASASISTSNARTNMAAPSPMSTSWMAPS